jgi:Fe2+ transport system protein FeoA
MIAPVQLDDLSNGQSARILQVRGRTEHIHRLEELGFRRGTDVEMVQAGSPCVIRLAGCKMCFRRCEHLNVLVTPRESV